jgi:hypothetical protein
LFFGNTAINDYGAPNTVAGKKLRQCAGSSWAWKNSRRLLVEVEAEERCKKGNHGKTSHIAGRNWAIEVSER